MSVMKPVFTREPPLNAMLEVYCALLIHFVEAIETNEFCVRFKIDRLHVKQTIKWIMFSNTIPAKIIADVM